MIKEEFDNLTNDKTLSFLLYFCFLAIFLQSLLLLLFFKKLPPKLPLFYSKPFGEEQLAKKNQVLILPFASFVFTILNLRLALLFLKEEKLLSQILVITSCLICFLSSICLIKIFSLVLVSIF